MKGLYRITAEHDSASLSMNSGATLIDVYGTSDTPLVCMKLAEIADDLCDMGFNGCNDTCTLDPEKPDINIFHAATVFKTSRFNPDQWRKQEEDVQMIGSALWNEQWRNDRELARHAKEQESEWLIWMRENER